MKIFEHYTGSALLNNSIQTIEALAQLGHASEIQPDILLKLFKKPIKDHSLTSLNKRFKSYTMIFTKNGPLHNDSEFGTKIYDALMKVIITNYENDGDKTCEVSGLRYQTTFEDFFTQALKKIKYPKKKIEGKDKSINRCWFPLLGSLGSDAQALPQAKFAVNIHPICLVIMQFLPLSALLYRGGVLLIDSINFDFSKDYIRDNFKIVKDKFEVTPLAQPIENIKDFSKGDYLLKGLDLYAKKHQFYDEYSDLNLWTFSNSGTGASCSIDRVPNQLMKKLSRLRSNPKCSKELKDFLMNKKYNGIFLECLESNKDFFRLYPAKGYGGVSIDFFEAYQTEIHIIILLHYAKYIAGLIKKYKSKSDAKLLEKTDAYKEKEYKTILYTTLIKAAADGEWTLKHHIDILNDQDTLPVNSSVSKIHKLVHYYYQKKHFSNELPTAAEKNTNAIKVCTLLINLIKQDEEFKRSKNRLINPQEYQDFCFNPLFNRSSEQFDLGNIKYLLYDENGNLKKYGILDLMRIYFSQKEEEVLEISEITYSENIGLKKYTQFAEDYTAYYLAKYTNSEMETIPYSKFEKHVLGGFPKDNQHFIYWLNEAIQNREKWYKENDISDYKLWTSNDLIYDEFGNFHIGFARFAIEFTLNKQLKILFKN